MSERIKTCVKCGTQFVGIRCRPCLHRFQAAWYQANRERERSKGAAYRATERYKARKAAYRPKQAEIEGRRRAIQRGVRVADVDRLAIIARDRSICHICGKKVKPSELHLDHLIPLSKGGPHAPENLAVAHARCNMSRGAGRLPAQLRMAA